MQIVARNPSVTMRCAALALVLLMLAGCGAESVARSGSDVNTLPATILEPDADDYEVVAAAGDRPGEWEFAVRPRDETAGELPLSFVWDFGDGAVQDGAHQTHVFNDPGSYLVTVAAFDPKGRLSFVLTLEVEIPAVNQAPHAVAGEDQTVGENEPVFLDGSGSVDPDGGALSYSWRQLAGEPVQLAHATTAVAGFVAPAVDADSRLVFALSVSDGELSAEATVAVDVVDLFDPAEVRPPECWFTLVPAGEVDQPPRIEAPRPLTVACIAVIIPAEPAVEGTLAWAFDGVPLSGPVETSTVVSQVFTRGGAHTVALALIVAGATTVSCHNGETGSTEERVYVWPMISGRIRDNGGAGIAAVTVSGSYGAGTAVSDADGSFKVHVPYNWSGELVAQHADYDFNPQGQYYAGVQSDVAGQEFVGALRVASPPTPPNPAGCLAHADCSDGLFCTGVESCVTGACQRGSNPCPDELCDEQNDTCYFRDCAVDADCEDGVFCNGAEKCDPRSGCRAGSPVDCEDGIACTIDSCNEATHTCNHIADHALCDNGSFCDGMETCHLQLGCQAGSEPCPPGEICDEARDGCQPESPVTDRWILVGDTWRYFKGRTAPPENWAALDFDDASWSAGPTGIGYSTDITYPTVLGDMLNSYVSFYARREFTVRDPAEVPALQLALLYDDGFIAYINGLEVARSANMVGAAGYDTLAASSHDEQEPEQQFIIAVAPGLLQGGVNVLAIEVHNVSIGSSDACLVPRLAPLGGSGECTQDSDCDDGLFCNGDEACSTGACVRGGVPCVTGESCDEIADICRPIEPGAWAPPIGIPEPSFGIREIAPAPPDPWSAPTPGFYYVDQSHPNATDSGNAYGTPAQPRVSIPNNLPEGAVVELHGVYALAHSSPRMIGGEGSPQSPIFIRGADSADRPLVTGTWEIKGHHVVLENLEFADDDGNLSGGEVGRPVILAPAHHVALRASEVSGNLNFGGVGVASWTGEAVHDVVIHDNLIHHNGDWQATYDQDRHGVGVGAHAYNVWIVDNEIHHNSGDGVQINGDATTHHIYVGRNLAWQNKQTGFWCKTAYDVVFSENESHSHTPSGSSPGAGMGWQYDGKRIWFLYNHVHDNTIGFRGASANQGGTEDIYLIGNLIHDTTDWAVEVWSADPIVYVLSNTISETGGGISAEKSSAFYISNNILSGAGGSPHVLIDANLAQRAHMDHCLLYEPGGSMTIEWDGRAFDSIAAFQAATGQGQDCVEGNPLFVGPAQDDYHLQTGSPAIGRGTPHAAYAVFQTLYGIDIAVDGDGVPRGQDGGYDIGAYEY